MLCSERKVIQTVAEKWARDRNRLSIEENEMANRHGKIHSLTINQRNETNHSNIPFFWLSNLRGLLKIMTLHMS